MVNYILKGLISMNRIISVFLNPAIDLTLWVKENGNGEPLSVTEERAYAAGKGVNVSKALTAAGIENLALGVIGRENREKFLNLLRSSVPRFDITEFSGKTRENLTIVLPDNKIMKVNYPGILNDRECLKIFREKLVRFSSEAEYVVFGGKIPDGISNDDYIDIINSVLGVKAIVDTSSFSLEDYKKLNLFAVKPNHNELSEITGLPCETDEEIIKAARLLNDSAENVIVSRGEKGLIVVRRDSVIKAVTPKVEAVSDIGCGDAALAGFIYADIEGGSDEQRALFAAAFGTAKTLVEGSGTVKKELIESIKEKVIIKRLEK